MLSLTTKEDDVVLDPFAGIGSVPAMAKAMDRIGYGIELSEHYASTYEDTVKSAHKFLTRIGNDTQRRANFSRTIIELRLLKFARILADQLNTAGFPISWVRTKISKRRPKQSHQVVAADFEIVLADDALLEPAVAAARIATQTPPLSKFGVDADLVSVDSLGAGSTGYWYHSGRFWTPPGQQTTSRWWTTRCFSIQT